MWKRISRWVSVSGCCPSIAARIARGEIDTAPLARDPRDTAPSPAISSRISARGPRRARPCARRSEPPPNGEGKRRITERFAVMLAQQVLYISVGRYCMGDLVASAKLKPLVSPIQVPVGQQQAVAELRIREIVAVVAPPDQRPCKGAI